MKPLILAITLFLFQCQRMTLPEEKTADLVLKKDSPSTAVYYEYSASGELKKMIELEILDTIVFQK